MAALRTHIGRIPCEVPSVAYGVISNFDDEGNFEYLCGVEVKEVRTLPQGLKHTNAPANRYVVFRHKGHVAGIHETMSAIWNNWLPKSGQKAINAPTLERYGLEFNPMTGMGGFVIWIPIEE